MKAKVFDKITGDEVFLPVEYYDDTAVGEEDNDGDLTPLGEKMIEKLKNTGEFDIIIEK